MKHVSSTEGREVFFSLTVWAPPQFGRLFSVALTTFQASKSSDKRFGKTMKTHLDKNENPNCEKVLRPTSSPASSSGVLFFWTSWERLGVFVLCLLCDFIFNKRGMETDWKRDIFPDRCKSAELYTLFPVWDASENLPKRWNGLRSILLPQTAFHNDPIQKNPPARNSDEWIRLNWCSMGYLFRRIETDVSEALGPWAIT